MKIEHKRGIPLPLILIFVSAVLVPSIALSVLALRAADRESLYVERRLESTLLAEANLASFKIEELMGTIMAGLRSQALTDPEWGKHDPLVGIPFLLQGGELTVLEGSASDRRRFRDSFGAFLEGGARLPVYDSIARVYRKEMQPQSSVKKTEASTHNAPSAASETLLATDSALREDAFLKAAQQGFEIAQRNVAPQKQSLAREALRDEGEDERSKTVSQSRTFEELRDELSGGLLPRLEESGLSLLFWTRRPDGAIVGCSLDLETLRQRVADVIPDVFSKVRILTVLDERGNPLVAPSLPHGQDWRRPFVAREIAPVLPRWEVAVWLLDPDMPASQARFAELAVGVLVAALFLVIALGSFAVLRMLSSEMRTAGQKTTFVANVSHELKTPLTSIRLFAELLLSGKQANEEKKREYLNIMVSEVDRLSRLIENVLSFARRGKGEDAAQYLDLAALAASTLGQLEPHLAGGGFTVEFFQGELLPVRGNREALRQVLMNLLSNAEKYSGERRSIRVSCGTVKGFAVVEVADRGIGVEPRLAEKIFQEFFRADDSLAASRSGVGLGLSIARDIARKYGGDVVYAPRNGGGSVFSLRLPRAETTEKTEDTKHGQGEDGA